MKRNKTTGDKLKPHIEDSKNKDDSYKVEDGNLNEDKEYDPQRASSNVFIFLTLQNFDIKTITILALTIIDAYNGSYWTARLDPSEKHLISVNNSNSFLLYKVDISFISISRSIMGLKNIGKSLILVESD